MLRMFGVDGWNMAVAIVAGVVALLIRPVYTRTILGAVVGKRKGCRVAARISPKSLLKIW